jgi:hypothetical protein
MQPIFGPNNPKGKYKIKFKATRTSDKCKGRIRCNGGVSIICWLVTSIVHLSRHKVYGITRGRSQYGNKSETNHSAYGPVIICNCKQSHYSNRRIWLIDWLIIYCFTSYSIIFHWRRHHYRWRAAKFKPMLGAQGLWAERDLYRITSAVTQGLGFSSLLRRIAPFSRLLRHPRECGGSILTRILTGRICEMMILNEIHYNPATSTFLSV